MSAPDYIYDDDEFPPCPKCNGDGYVNCYCGGDQCYCENHGEAVCTLCHGEGEVSEEREKAYLKAEAENSRVWREAAKKAGLVD